MSAVAERSNFPLRKVREIVTSRHNVKKLTDLLEIEKINPRTQTKVNTVHFDPEGKQVLYFPHNICRVYF